MLEICLTTQLSIIQLGGGLAVGIYAQREKRYTLLDTPKMLVLEGISTGVRATTCFFSCQLSNSNSPQMWNVGSVLCDLIIAICMTYYVGFPTFLLLVVGEPIKSHFFLPMAAFAI